MALFPQNHYRQPYGYSQPVVGYSYPQPPQPPVYHLDPVTFRRDYSVRLAELTVNSRPIIQNLSMLAQEYSRFAEIVAQCIEAHIRRVPPWMKLPAFYLVDAISKNVFEPYARHFATFVIPLFLETYEQVDQNTRGKMEEMLLTWRTGAPSGKELFGIGPQINIERSIWGGESNGPEANPASYSGTGQTSKSQVVSELEFTLSQKERLLQVNPYDSVSQNHVAVLQQLRNLVEVGVSQEELQQILNQLRALGRSVPPPTLPPPPPPPPVLSHHSQSLTHAPQTSYPDFNLQTVPPPPSQPTYGQLPVQTYPAYDHLKAETVDSSSQANNPPDHPAPTTAISSLFDALVKAGVVSAAVTGAGYAAKELEQNPVDLEREASRTYRKAVLAQPVRLSTAEIMKRRPQIVQFLYDQLPSQCKQCGIRFADNTIGKRRMQGHLDMHFRQNRKANQSVGRGHSRSWFVGVEDWIHDVSSDPSGKGIADGSRRLSAKAAAAAEVAKRDAELRAQFVVVPPGHEAKTISCPICKEVLKSEFLEDDEEWVWKNAVRKDDRVYHATCRAEAVVSTNTLAARLRTELAQRSRSGTPEAQSLRSTPPKSTSSGLKADIKQSSRDSPEPTTGTKRKIDNDTALRDPVDSGTPPFKKAALAA